MLNSHTAHQHDPAWIDLAYRLADAAIGSPARLNEPERMALRLLATWADRQIGGPSTRWKQRRDEQAVVDNIEPARIERYVVTTGGYEQARPVVAWVHVHGHDIRKARLWRHGDSSPKAIAILDRGILPEWDRLGPTVAAAACYGRFLSRLLGRMETEPYRPLPVVAMADPIVSDAVNLLCSSCARRRRVQLAAQRIAGECSVCRSSGPVGVA
jgi:hypothetical protein